MPLAYYLEKAESLSGPWSEIDGPLAANESDTTQSGDPRCFWVRVRRELNGVTTYSEPAEAVMMDASVLTATGGLGEAAINLSWTATCASTYKLFKYRPESNEYLLLVETTETEFDDVMVSNGVTYYYYVVGTTPDGCEGETSNIASASITQGGVFSMARATAYQGIQLGVESTAGTGVAAVKRLLNMGLEVVPQIPIRTVKYPGSKVATDTQRGQEHSEGRVNGVLDYNTIIYILSSMFGTVTPTTEETLDFQRLWNPSTRAPLTPKSYTIEQGSTRGAEKWTYSIFNELTIKGNKTEVSIEAGMFGQKTNRGITMTTASLATIAAAAVDPYSVGVYYSTDGSSYTKLTDDFDWEFRLGTMWKPNFHVNDSNASYDDVTELMPDMGGTWAFEEGSEVDTMVSKLYSGDKIWIRAVCTGALIEAGSPNIYQLIQISMPVFVIKNEPGDKDDAWGNSVSFEAAEDTTTGMVEVKVINTLSAVAAGV